MQTADCPFCRPLPPERVIAASSTSIAFLDGFPVSNGHTLVIPKRHVSSIFDLPGSERTELWALVDSVRRILADRFHPQGFNIGLNDGNAAGQTIGHAHIHVIPRYKGDLPDPRGGVRWVIPSKARYW